MSSPEIAIACVSKKPCIRWKTPGKLEHQALGFERRRVVEVFGFIDKPEVARYRRCFRRAAAPVLPPGDIHLKHISPVLFAGVVVSAIRSGPSTLQFYYFRR